MVPNKKFTIIYLSLFFTSVCFSRACDRSSCNITTRELIKKWTSTYSSDTNKISVLCCSYKSTGVLLINKNGSVVTWSSHNESNECTEATFTLDSFVEGNQIICSTQSNDSTVVENNTVEAVCANGSSGTVDLLNICSSSKYKTQSVGFFGQLNYLIPVLFS